MFFDKSLGQFMYYVAMQSILSFIGGIMYCFGSVGQSSSFCSWPLMQVSYIKQEVTSCSLTAVSSPSSFLKLYGRRFSKEDHILFINLLYELVTLPNLEPHMMCSYARLLIQLLKWVWKQSMHMHYTMVSVESLGWKGLGVAWRGAVALLNEQNNCKLC